MSITNMLGQAEQTKFDEKYFPSVFANVESGKFEGTANGALLLKNSEGQDFILDFQKCYGSYQRRSNKKRTIPPIAT